ncbi:MAG TPA: serine/threonine-protein kinase [Burkholderiales bacterium]|nr:serine/threonine-protein kinase [Burkholderiales bacterium]
MLSTPGRIAVLAAAIVLLVALGAWTYGAVEDSLREMRAGSMRALLATHTTALRATLEERLEGAPASERAARIREVAARYAESAGRLGESGEVFAFDARGAVLNPSRSGETTASLLRRSDPGGEGMSLEPFVNARGEEVIAVWNSLPDYGIGLAIKLAGTEAYAPLRFLRIAFGVVFGALVLAALAALVSALQMLQLRSEMGGGRRLGAYVLGRRIGEGGMANVYLARHDLLKRPTAVKLLKPARASDEMIARFEREVQLASSLAHPNTVEIFDYGRTADGLFYYAMEYLDGITAADLVAREGHVPVARAVHLLRQVCAGLAEAHSKGLVHRDIKPENIMVCRRGGEADVVKILDFGLVKSIATPHSRDLTRSLRILGTPLYMAPERLRNPADVDARADIYAVGAVAFLLLTGRKLYEAADDLALTTRILNEEPPRASAVAPQAIPAELDILVAACLEKKREDRPQRAADLVEAFEALASELPWTQREATEWWARIPATG